MVITQNSGEPLITSFPNLAGELNENSYKAIRADPFEDFDGERSGGDGVARSGPIRSPVPPVASHRSVRAQGS